MKRSTLKRMVVPQGGLTSGGLMLRAGFVTAFFILCHLFGWRDYVRFLSGTDPSGEGLRLHMTLGILYVISFIGFTFLAPILALSAGLLHIFNSSAGRG